MAAPTDVPTFMASLDHPLKAAIEAVRRLVLSADPRLREHIKWNAPSFAVTEDLVTLRLHPQPMLQLVLHTGAKKRPTPLDVAVDDPAGLLRRLAPDRGIIAFSALDEVEARGAALVALVRQWVAQVEGPIAD
ncbi:MAG TPA: DUF1801 domain-containing protein [Herpetosiphonaceae bacterium]|nr:DUF1801 domain-containing protein [Herpetosiphonaceae bacterium]